MLLTYNRKCKYRSRRQTFPRIRRLATKTAQISFKWWEFILGACEIDNTHCFESSVLSKLSKIWIRLSTEIVSYFRKIFLIFSHNNFWPINTWTLRDYIWKGWMK